MKFILLCTTAVFVMGCSVQVKPICNREAQTWDKFNTVEDVCFVPPIKVVDKDHDRKVNTPVDEDHPDDTDHSDDDSNHDDSSDDNHDHDYNGDHSDSNSSDSNDHNDDQ